MLFNSFTFILFFCAFCLGWPFVRNNSNLRWFYIVIFSLFFYGWWNWKYVFLLLATGLVDFSAGLGIFYYRRYSKLILWLSIFINLAVLGFFKYWQVVIEGVNEIAKIFGSDLEVSASEILLPVGISFYTFQSMSYTIDIYNQKCKPTNNFLHFLSAISFFPHLVAGPIMRASKLLPQLLVAHSANRVERLDGLRLIAHGFFKKVVIADNLAATISEAFGGPVSSHSGVEWWVLVTMFSMQIYCDFSGYSDIARGLAKWLGYEFTLNFDHPYAAKSLKEFWSRWHISLSTWFRDYVYIPLGGSKNGEILAYTTITITMVLSAIWHGAALTFVMWGVLHSVFLCAERFIGWPKRLRSIPIGDFLAWSVTILQVWIAWIFFRATSVKQGFEILQTMLFSKSLSFGLSATAITFLILGIIHEIYTYNAEKSRVDRYIALNEIIILILIITGCVFLRGPGNSFIYFQF